MVFMWPATKQCVFSCLHRKGQMIWTGENKILKMLTEGLLSLKGGKITEQTVGGKCNQQTLDIRNYR